MQKKWKIIITSIIMFLIFIILFILWNYGVFDKEDKTKLLWKNRVIEVYQNVKLSDFVDIKDGALIENRKINTNTVGRKKITFEYVNSNKRKRKSTIMIEVVDTTKPYVALSNKVTVVKGTKRDLEKEILCADNYDSKPKCKIIGNYNVNELGTYELIFRATDKSGNQNEIPFILNVIEEKKENNNGNQIAGTVFQEVVETYKDEDTMIGIDVSKWQGKIDWQKVKESGVEFAMIRLGTQRGIGKDSVLDPYFKENMKMAKKVGIPVGVYYFSYASSTDEALSQASWVVEQLKPYQLSLPISFDWETFSIFNQLNISIYNLNEIASSFIKEVQKHNYDGVLYSSKNYLEHMWTYLEQDVWLAHYTNQTNYEGDYMMWQLSNTGKVPGIDGFVDLNILYRK